MAIAKEITKQIHQTSLIRVMFDEGRKLKNCLGEENVYDFSLGNPAISPPRGFFSALRNFSMEEKPGRHSYTDNAGLESTRQVVGQKLTQDLGLNFSSEQIALTVGAGGGVNVALRCLLDPGDEVIVITPYFPEYDYYISFHQGQMTKVAANEDFSLDLAAIENSITTRTKVLLLNSPNNPTGRVYTAEELKGLANILQRAGRKFGRPIYIIADEPYRDLYYTDHMPEPISFYPNTILVTSFSKTLSIPGERIGYLAMHPGMEDLENFALAVKFTTRALGYVNAPGIMQHLLPDLLEIPIAKSFYQRNREIITRGLSEAGYEFSTPDGAFFLFPKSPIPDDVEFARLLKDEFRILVVPGSGFSCPGYFRIAYCCSTESLQAAVPLFQEAIYACKSLVPCSC